MHGAGLLNQNFTGRDHSVGMNFPKGTYLDRSQCTRRDYSIRISRGGTTQTDFIPKGTYLDRSQCTGRDYSIRILRGGTTQTDFIPKGTYLDQSQCKWRDHLAWQINKETSITFLIRMPLNKMLKYGPDQKQRCWRSSFGIWNHIVYLFIHPMSLVITYIAKCSDCKELTE